MSTKYRFFLTVTIISFLTACSTIKTSNKDIVYLPNMPVWKTSHFPKLSDLLIRCDSIKAFGSMKDSAYIGIVNFDYFLMYVDMNVERSSGISHPSKYKRKYQRESIVIDLLVSDSLSSLAIAAFQKEDKNINIEKGYFGHNNFLYINDYNNESYLIVNLVNKRVYKLKQNDKNFNTHSGCINAFIMSEDYQGIRFFLKETGGTYSIGSHLKY